MKNHIIGTALNELYKIYNALNVEYYNNTLPEVVITIQSTVKAYGHFAPDRWKDKADKEDIVLDKEIEIAENEDEIVKYHELNIGAEHLKRNIYHLCATVQHEMVHLYCHINDIQDTSNNNRYHNKRFKIEAEQKGLYIEKAPTIGYSITEPSESFITFIDSLDINKEAFKFFRSIPAKVKSKSEKTTSYKCPHCEESVRGPLGLNILCKDCNMTMKSKDQKGEET